MLEGRFGQTAGIGATISKVSNTNISERIKDTDTYSQNLDSSKKTIKIVDFDKEKKSSENNSEQKIKIKTF